MGKLPGYGSDETGAQPKQRGLTKAGKPKIWRMPSYNTSTERKSEQSGKQKKKPK